MTREGIELIKSFEGLSLEAYQCQAGVWTIGYGHTGIDVKKGNTITKNEAEKLLVKELEKLEAQVNFLLKDVSLNDNQVSALVSLVYNIGLGAFKKSKLLEKINKKSNLELIAKEWIEFNKVKGIVNKGLLRRRAAEIELYNR